MKKEFKDNINQPSTEVQQDEVKKALETLQKDNQVKIEKCNQEINEVLAKYGFTLKYHTHAVLVPRE